MVRMREKIPPVLVVSPENKRWRKFTGKALDITQEGNYNGANLLDKIEVSGVGDHGGKVNVTNQVVSYIGEHIQSGAWPVGEKIPSENQLTEQLGVSRASLRAAIRHFVGLGALDSVHGKGTFVISDQIQPMNGGSGRFTSEDFQDIQKVLEFRWLIEPEACYMAAQRADAQMLARLRQQLDLLVEHVGDQQAFVQADIAFHLEICRQTGNPLILKSMQMVYQESRKDFDLINEQFGYKDGVYYHTLICKALEDGNGELARDYMQEHLRQALDRMEIEG